MYSEINENYQVLFLQKDDLFLKESFSSKVYKLLEKAYNLCGGIKTGSGFKNESDMVHSIPFWRLTFKNGELFSAMMFKEKSSTYKMVAYAPLTQIDSDIRFGDIQYMMNNSYAELSGALLIIVLKHLGSNWKRYLLNFETIMFEKKSERITEFLVDNEIPKNCKKLYDRLCLEWPKLVKYCHVRSIGTEYKIKVLLGTTNCY